MNTQELYDYIHKNFEYRDGHLYYKVRTANCTQIGQRAGAVSKGGYQEIKIKGKTYKEHRLVYLYHKNYLPDVLDHIDQNKLNNKIENLRAISKLENSQNRGKNKNNSSGYKGVTYRKDIQKWHAQTMVNGKKIHLGQHETPELAYEAYCNYVQNNLTIYCLGDNNGCN